MRTQKKIVPYWLTASLVPVLLLLSLSDSVKATPIDDECKAKQGIEVFCGFRNPEDIVLVPGSKQLIISQIGSSFVGTGSSPTTPGSLVSFDTESKQIRSLYPVTENHIGSGPLPLWGDETCTKPPAHFSPLGIDLARRSDGQLMLLVTNRTRALDGFSVQMFSVIEKDQLALQWRGCVEAPAYVIFGEVAALPRNGFVVPAYNLIPEEAAKRPFYEALVSYNKGGDVLSWHKNTGFVVSVSVKDPRFNGIAASKDGKFVYQNEMKPLRDGGGVVKFDLEKGQLYGMAELPMPDNSSWDEEGNLLIASPRHSDTGKYTEESTAEKSKNIVKGYGITDCYKTQTAVCHGPFDIYSVNPQTMEKELIFSHNGDVIGFVTSALQVGKYIYLGMATGNRIARIVHPKYKGLQQN